jgi:RHS repeat-associated protein
MRNPHRYAGAYTDPDGTQPLGQRVYDPVSMRFTTEDPAPTEFTRYAYADLNPITRSDPTGEAASADAVHWAVTALIVAVTIAGTLFDLATAGTAMAVVGVVALGVADVAVTLADAANQQTQFMPESVAMTIGFVLTAASLLTAGMIRRRSPSPPRPVRSAPAAPVDAPRPAAEKWYRIVDGESFVHHGSPEAWRNDPFRIEMMAGNPKEPEFDLWLMEQRYDRKRSEQQLLAYPEKILGKFLPLPLPPPDVVRERVEVFAERLTGLLDRVGDTYWEMHIVASERFQLWREFRRRGLDEATVRLIERYTFTDTAGRFVPPASLGRGLRQLQKIEEHFEALERYLGRKLPAPQNGRYWQKDVDDYIIDFETALGLRY